MQHRPALMCGRGFTNRRGAVLLLAIYFVSLLLLILGGISLQRTTIESRAAQVSRNNQQAFFLAEGALDIALSKLRASDLADGCYLPEDSDSCTKIQEMLGGTSFTLATAAAQIVSPQTQQITRAITATGTASGASATVCPRSL